MNILFLSSTFPNPINPTGGCFNDSLVRALAIRHRVEVVSPIPWVDLVKGYRRGIHVPMNDRIFDPAGFGIHYTRFYYTPKLLRGWYGHSYWLSIAGTVRSLIRTHRPDLIIAYWAHPDGKAAARIGRLAGACSCVIVGGSDVLLLTRGRSRRHRIQKVLEANDAVLVVNEDLKHAVQRLGIHATKVHVWRQGLDTDRFRPGDRQVARQRLGIPADGRVIVWVGRMVPVKGLDILLAACARLRDHDIKYHLYLVGEGPLRGQYTAQAESRGLCAHVTFVGSRLQEELAEWYRAADLTVLPSRSEGLPNVLRESLASGTPFVASDVGGISEIADPNCSLLVPPEDPAALADAIAQGLTRWVGKQIAIPPKSQQWEESANSLVRIMQPYTVSPTLGPCAQASRNARIR